MAKLKLRTSRPASAEPVETWAPPAPADAVAFDLPAPDAAATDATFGESPAEEIPAVEIPAEATTTEEIPTEDTLEEGSTEEGSTTHDDDTTPIRVPGLAARVRAKVSGSWAADRYARRRFAVLAVAAVALGVLASRSYGTGSSATGEVSGFADVDSTLPTSSSSRPLDEVLDDALAHQARTGTFAGFAQSGVLVAASTDTVVLAAYHDSVCTYTAIEAGVRRAVLVDQSGSACTQDAIDEVQASLALAALDAEDDAVGRLRELVPNLRRAVLMYASLSYVNGEPNLAGLAEVPVPGATLRTVALSGSSAVFELRDGETCRTVKVYADAARAPGPLRPC